jgi:hypothetical protein
MTFEKITDGQRWSLEGDIPERTRAKFEKWYISNQKDEPKEFAQKNLG